MKIQYNRNRYLDYYTGRWLTHDPLGYVDGMSLYENIVSNPLIYLDPYGLKSECKEGDIDVKIKNLNYAYMSGIRLVTFSENPILTIYISKSGKVSIENEPKPITWKELIDLLINEDKYILLPKCISTEHIYFWQLRYNFGLDLDIRECECKCYVREWIFWKKCIQWGWEDWRSETVSVQTDWLGDAGAYLERAFTFIVKNKLPIEGKESLEKQIKYIEKEGQHINNVIKKLFEGDF